ncbi:MAG: Hint domain-containing homing endonuclease [Desulfobacterales bacterium]
MITCKVCGHQAHNLKPHFIGGREASCTVTENEYAKKYPYEPLVSEIFKRKLEEIRSQKTLEKALTVKQYNVYKTFGVLVGSKETTIDGFVERSNGVPEIDPEYQFPEEATKIALLGLQTNRPTMVHGPTGCHSKGTSIMMADGTLKTVESIAVGDKVMGPDGKPRNVIRLFRGYDDLYQIAPNKGKPFIVNADHVLTLQRTNTKKAENYSDRPQYVAQRIQNDIIDIKLRDWFNLSNNKKHIYKLFRVPIDEFDTQKTKLEIDPYFLGVLLGDGHLNTTPSVATPDPEIVQVLEREAKKLGMELTVYKNGRETCSTYKIVRKTYNSRTKNPLTIKLERYGLSCTKADTKFIPHEYKTSSKKDRYEILAGLMDTDGSLAVKERGKAMTHAYDFISKSKRLAEDVAFIARSLGLCVSVNKCTKGCQNDYIGFYYRVYIGGRVDEIPCRVKYKQASERCCNEPALRTGFSVEKAGEGEFFGFQLTGDGRYLLDDFMVTHNSGKSTLIEQIAARINYPVMRVNHHKDMYSYDIVGQKKIEDGKTAFEYGPAPIAMQQPMIYIMDEWDATNPEVALLYQSLLERKLDGERLGDLVLTANSGQRIESHPKFRIVATSNTTGLGDDSGYYQGTEVQNIAFISRFLLRVKLDYMDQKREAALLTKKFPALDKEEANGFAKVANLIRKRFEAGELNVPYSIRDLINWVDLFLMIGDASKAMQYSCSSILPYSDEKIISEIVQRVFD